MTLENAEEILSRGSVDFIAMLGGTDLELKKIKKLLRNII